uniref:Uncharacterized protein n=1 Tax=viral metagenome TaxID=1070528 RepID=A0A6M3LHJ0_9ZZZZ
MAKIGSFNYDRFNKLFHKGEQIVVGFREDYTHGYISKIDETGFGLIQLKQPKEYWYDWEHFEVAMHPGFRFKKLPVDDEWIDRVNTLTLSLLGDKFPDPSRVDDTGIHYQFHNCDDVIACVSRFNIKPKEIEKFTAEQPWGRMAIKINNGKADIKAYNSFVNTLPQGKDFDIIRFYFFDDDCLTFRGDGLESKSVRDGKELDVMRITELGKRVYVSSGDPWYTDEPVEKIGFNMWKSKDGYAMSHSKAIIVEVICK